MVTQLIKDNVEELSKGLTAAYHTTVLTVDLKLGGNLDVTFHISYVVYSNG